MRAASIDEYVADPVGRFVAGRTYAVWIESRVLAGSAYFGRVDEREVADIVRLTTLPESWADPRGYDVLVDCARLEMMDGTVFAALTRRIADMPSGTRLRRTAIVRPAGMAGAIIAGVFHDAIQPRFQAALFADRAEAAAWLGCSVGARARIDRVIAAVVTESPQLRTLRDYLRDNPASGSLADAARTVGMSERSLSRRLNELGTSYRDELALARLRAAEALLVNSDAKLEDVATRVGFASRAHFSDFFRRATGETPSDFRARRR